MYSFKKKSIKEKFKNKKVFIFHRCMSSDIHFWKPFLENKKVDNILLLNTEDKFKTNFKDSLNISFLKKSPKVLLKTIKEVIKKIEIVFFILFFKRQYWITIKKGKVPILKKYLFISINDEINKFKSLSTTNQKFKKNYFIQIFALYYRACNNIALAQYLNEEVRELYLGYGHKVYTDFIFDLYFLVYTKAKVSFFALGHYSQNINDVFFSSKINRKKNYDKSSNYKPFPILKKAKENKAISNINIIYLPVIGDSPNHAISWSRLFLDYFSWLDHIFKIIINSDEIWIFRIHPHSIFWGEDTKKILIKKYKKFFKKNIIIHNPIEKCQLEYDFKTAHRIITFSGTIVAEAAIQKIKSISINSGLTNVFDEDLVWIPKNIQEFNNLMMDKLDKENFVLNEKQSKPFEEYFTKKIIRNKIAKLRWKNNLVLNEPVTQKYEDNQLFTSKEIRKLVENKTIKL